MTLNQIRSHYKGHVWMTVAQMCLFGALAVAALCFPSLMLVISWPDWISADTVSAPARGHRLCVCLCVCWGAKCKKIARERTEEIDVGALWKPRDTHKHKHYCISLLLCCGRDRLNTYCIFSESLSMCFRSLKDNRNVLWLLSFYTFPLSGHVWV